MQLKVFSLALDPETGELDDSAMRVELENCVVAQVWEHFLPTERLWLVMVSYRPPSSGTHGFDKSGGARGERKRGKDWRSELAPHEYQIFEALRGWREQTAKQIELPVHFILSNQQLAAIAQTMPQSKKALGEVKGVGNAKLNRFGESLLLFLEKTLTTLSTEEEKVDQFSQADGHHQEQKENSQTEEHRTSTPPRTERGEL